MSEQKQLSKEDREILRGKIKEGASYIKKNYGWSISSINRKIHEIVDATV